MLTEAREKLKQEICKLENETIIQNLLMYVMGMQAQKALSVGTVQPQDAQQPTHSTA